MDDDTVLYETAEDSFVMPGFIDGHNHIAMFCKSRFNASLSLSGSTKDDYIPLSELHPPCV